MAPTRAGGSRLRWLNASALPAGEKSALQWVYPKAPGAHAVGFAK